jgi:hypothetical protein
VHERGLDLSPGELSSVADTLRLGFANLSQMGDLWGQIANHRDYRSEVPIRLKFDGEPIEVKPDLLFVHTLRHPVIIDWKCLRTMSGSDTASQLQLYAWAVMQLQPWRDFDCSKIELIEVLPLSGEVKHHPFDERQFIEVEDQLFEAVHEIRRLFGKRRHDEIDISELTWANSPGSCAFCPFIEMCKGADHGHIRTESVRNRKCEQLPLFVSAG